MKMHTRKQNMTVEPRRSQFNESQPFVILISHPSGSLMRILCRYDEGNACGCLSWTIARQCVRKDLTFNVCILSITWTYLPYYFHIDSFLTSWPFYILYCYWCTYKITNYTSPTMMKRITFLFMGIIINNWKNGDDVTHCNWHHHLYTASTITSCMRLRTALITYARQPTCPGANIAKRRFYEKVDGFDPTQLCLHGFRFLQY